MRIILASESPFRKHALDVLGLDYQVIPSQIDEKAYPREDPVQLVTTLSREKTLTVARGQTGAIVIGGDAVVAMNGRIYEKPRDLDEAFSMLSSLSGNTFKFITGLVVHNCDTAENQSSVRSLSIAFRPLLAHEIRDYITRYPVLKCAGAFEVDGMLRFTEHVEGCLNIGGALPVGDLVRFLRTQGVMV